MVQDPNLGGYPPPQPTVIGNRWLSQFFKQAFATFLHSDWLLKKYFLAEMVVNVVIYILSKKLKLFSKFFFFLGGGWNPWVCL
jgi:hypothetical protein